MADTTPKSYHTDPQLYLYTSLSSGSSQIVTATSRIQTILKANKIEYQALDVATDEKARMLWGRRAGKKKLPGLVKMGMVLGDLEQVEEWNEFGEIEENLGDQPVAAPAGLTSASSASTTMPSADQVSKDESTPSQAPSLATDAPPAPALPPSTTSTNEAPKPTADTATPAPSSSTTTESLKGPIEPTKSDAATGLANAMRSIGFEAAKKAGDAKIKARNERIEAAKAKNPELSKKLDSSTGTPVEAGASEAAQTSEAPATTTTANGEAAEEAEEHVPESKEVEEAANTAILKDEAEEEVLEGTGQAEEVPAPSTTTTATEEKKEEANEKEEEPAPSSSTTTAIEGTETEEKDEPTATAEKPKAEKEGGEEEVPTAKEAEEQANKAVLEDRVALEKLKDSDVGSAVPPVSAEEAAPAAEEEEADKVSEVDGHNEGTEQEQEKEKDTHAEAEREKDHDTTEHEKEPSSETGTQEKEKEEPAKTKTQEQPAASASHAAHSVED